MIHTLLPDSKQHVWIAVFLKNKVSLHKLHTDWTIYGDGLPISLRCKYGFFSKIIKIEWCLTNLKIIFLKYFFICSVPLGWFPETLNCFVKKKHKTRFCHLCFHHNFPPVSPGGVSVEIKMLQFQEFGGYLPITWF